MPKPELEIYLISGLDHRKAAQEAGASGFFHRIDDYDALKDLATAQKGRRVVLIDDNQDSLETWKRFFELRGAAEVYTFTNPQEALKRIPEINPDVVLSDVNMPRMSGIEVVRRLRGSE